MEIVNDRYVDVHFSRPPNPSRAVAPIILNHNLSEETADKLADFISRHSNERTLIIGSVDFSHYLSSVEAEANDKITEQAIRDYDYGKIFSLSDAYVDSPITLATVMKVVKLLDAGESEFINHGNSAGMANLEDELSSTSYFTILYFSPLISGVVF